MTRPGAAPSLTMKATIACKQCGTTAAEIKDPRELQNLTCASCGTAADPRAAEDFSSAIEDALSQLALLAKTTELSITLDTTAIPSAFVGEEDP